MFKLVTLFGAMRYETLYLIQTPKWNIQQSDFFNSTSHQSFIRGQLLASLQWTGLQEVKPMGSCEGGIRKGE